MAGYVMRQFTCPKAVTHPSTNRARCRATRYRYTKPRTKLQKSEQHTFDVTVKVYNQFSDSCTALLSTRGILSYWTAGVCHRRHALCTQYHVIISVNERMARWRLQRHASKAAECQHEAAIVHTSQRIAMTRCHHQQQHVICAILSWTCR